MQWKPIYAYYLIAAAAIISMFFFSDEKILLPKWPTLFFILFMAYAAAEQSFEAWKRKGTLIVSDLGIGKGGGTGYQTSGDLRTAKSHGDKPAFAVLATGGFNYAGLSLQGQENFIVCPPEHIMQFSGHFLIKTHLRNVSYRQLPNYVQDELNKLPKFRKEVVARKKNLWFGMTSSYYGSDTQESLNIEQNFLEKMSLSDERKAMLTDLLHEKSIFDKFKSNTGKDQKYKVVEQWKDEE